MAAISFDVEAQQRDDLGKSASRRLRREAKVLGVVYGGGEAAASISMEHRKVSKLLENEAVHTHILNLHVNGKKQKVVLRDIQRHPYKPIILHMDFLRVSDTDYLHMDIPLHFVGGEKCPGVLNGGIINHLISEVEVRCQVSKLPEHIDVDISNMNLEDDIRLSQIPMPAGIEVVMLNQGHDISVVSVHLPRQSKLDEEQAAEEAASAAEAAELAAEEAAAAGLPTLDADKEKAEKEPEKGGKEGHGHEGKDSKK